MVGPRRPMARPASAWDWRRLAGARRSRWPHRRFVAPGVVDFPLPYRYSRVGASPYRDGICCTTGTVRANMAYMAHQPDQALTAAIARVLRQARDGGMTTSEIADYFGVADPTISRWETGARSVTL